MNPYAPPWAGGLGGSPFHAEIESSPTFQRTMSGVLFYATAGVLDPKAPIIDVPIAARALQVGYWTAYGLQLPYAIAGMLTFGVVFDPSSKFPNWGYDDFIEGQEMLEYTSWQPTGMVGSV